MTKKATTEEKAEVVKQPEIKQAIVKETNAKQKAEPTWEYKDRVYVLKNGKSPLLFTLPSRHSQRKPLLYFDKDLGYQRELRYATNQKHLLLMSSKGHLH